MQFIRYNRKNNFQNPPFEKRQRYGVFIWSKFMGICLTKGSKMKDKKTISVGVRLTEAQDKFLQKKVDDGEVKSKSAAIQEIINKAMI